ncbi:MAG: hypothetical protein ACI30S_00650 [Muribaculaceae bacterium]
MKTFFKSIIIFVMSISLCSCSTWQTLKISGEPGTKIYSPAKTQITTVGQSGIGEVKLSRDVYWAYMLAKKPNSDKFVPFALNYENKSYNGTRFAEGVAMTVAFAGLAAVTGGFIADISGSESDANSILLGAGGGAALASTFAGMAVSSRLNETQREYRFKYLDNQSSKIDVNFTPIKDTGLKSGETPKDNPVQSKVEVSSNNGCSSSKVSSRKVGIKCATDSEVINIPSSSKVSKRKLDNNAKFIEGVYVGSGSLLEGDVVAESYSNIQIKIERVDNNRVFVTVFENGSPYFDAACSYTVKKLNDGKYSLTLDGIPSATITIDQKSGLIYYHPKVSIEDSIYTLKIDAKKI